MRFSPIFLGAIVLCIPELASAHAFGQIYNLPVPFWLYTYGAAAALLASFLALGFLFKESDGASYRFRDITDSSVSRFFRYPYILEFCRHAGIFFFALTLISGIIGQNSFAFNWNMTFFWIIFWLGMTYLVALFGDVWQSVNPWQSIYNWFANLPPKTEHAPIVHYPERLGVLPALLFFFGFIWLELVGHTTPLTLSLILTVYSLVTFAGMRIFGAQAWLARGEFFSVYFGFVARLAPLGKKEGKAILRLPFLGLLDQPATHVTELVFILFMIASTSFDGLQETLFMLKAYLPVQDIVSYDVFRTTGLLVVLVACSILYFAFIWLAKVLSQSEQSVKKFALGFAATLIPIGLAYSVAHYYTMLVVQGQDLFRLVSDPFGYGWDLFGTVGYKINIDIVKAGFVWHSQVAIILVGHIASVYLAHIVGLRMFGVGKRAFWSQFPMLILMVAYTVIGLWILSQPIVSG